MNKFADTLLSLLFGWMRTFVEGIWNSFSSGQMQDTISWLGDHWLLLVLLLCVVCTVLDYFIWFIRWKPYVIWRNKLRRLFGHKESSEDYAEYYTFQRGYDQGVEMDLSGFPADSQPIPEDAAYLSWQPEDEPASSYAQPVPESTQTYPQMPIPEQTQAYAHAKVIRQTPAQPPVSEPAPVFSQKPAAQPMQYYPQHTVYEEPAVPNVQPVHPIRTSSAPADAAPSVPEDACLQPVSAYLPDQSMPRPRRSQRYEKKKSRLSGFLPTADEESEQLLDGLPPAVDQNEAFRAPVYPRQYNNQQG